jgi:hypothetical protein
MYKKGNLKVGDPYYYIGKMDVLRKMGCKPMIVAYIDDSVTGKPYTIGHKKDVKQLIVDLKKILKGLPE